MNEARGEDMRSINFFSDPGEGNTDNVGLCGGRTAPAGRPTYEDFVDLQAAIVRAIALAWTNKDFKEHYKKKPVATLYALLPKESRLHNSRLSMEITDSDFHDFDPGHTGGWTGDDDDVTFYLPPPPEHQDQRAAALTAYAQTFTLLGGRAPNANKPPRNANNP